MVQFDDINRAYERVRGHIHRTPVLTSRTLNRWVGGELYFKCENFQRGGAFKFRGALNAVLMLSDAEAARGVVTHSSGNHGGALALAARERGIPAHVVLPRDAVGMKRQAVLEYGGFVVPCDPDLGARQATAAQVTEQTGAILVHPYDDARVIAGQGTVGLEVIEQVQGLDMLIAPVGGGGLLSGIAVAVASRAPRVALMGAEPAEADDARRSLLSGERLPSENPRTIADGLRAGLGTLTFPILQRYVGEIITAREDTIVESMRMLWERMKIVVEPSAAVALAALKERPDLARGRRIGVVLTGGNVDLARLPWQHGVEASTGS